MQKLILASASPRRSAMLREMGITFETVPSPFIEPEHADGQHPRSYVKANARGKARLVAENRAEGIIIGADTVVVHRGRVLGKPASMNQARQFLAMLNGDKHDVLTGVCLIDAHNSRMLVEAEKTTVTFRRLNSHEINRYLQCINPLDKAGAYAIQSYGSIIVERITGCYYNVVGFPIARIEKMLLHWGCSLFDFISLSGRKTR
jgi:septum formation protein